ncbi:MAG: hypothetical protein OIF50_09085 [Flavobacteriaceae bacterium]|nr:hypothetical protein [Flavobacteriaceae bacterium]
MKELIKNFKEKIDKLEASFKESLVDYFKNSDYENANKETQITLINKEIDIDKVYTGRGFYIILTQHKFSDNNCSFKLHNQTAIYRGHSYSVKKRILSHLSNERYNSLRKPNEPEYTVCIKIKDGDKGGINIDEKPYSNWKWMVVVHKMIDSKQIMREQAEHAFDTVYGKPCKSKEK